jgi:Cu+-exporting ATPase
MQKVTLNIGGMHCGSCATGIQMLTSTMDGVKSSFVDYDKKEGVIEFDESKVAKEAIIKAITELGYTAS